MAAKEHSPKSFYDKTQNAENHRSSVKFKEKGRGQRDNRTTSSGISQSKNIMAQQIGKGEVTGTESINTIFGRGKITNHPSKLPLLSLLTVEQPGQNVKSAQTSVPHPIRQSKGKLKNHSKFSSCPQPLAGCQLSVPECSKNPQKNYLRIKANFHTQQTKRFQTVSSPSVSNNKENPLPSLLDMKVQVPKQNRVYKFPKKKSVKSNIKMGAIVNQNVNAGTLKEKKKQIENNKLLNSQLNSATVSGKSFVGGNKITSQKNTLNPNLNYNAQDKNNFNSNKCLFENNHKKPIDHPANDSNYKKAKRNNRAKKGSDRVLLDHLLLVVENGSINVNEIRCAVNNLELNIRDDSCLIEVIDVLNQLGSDEGAFRKDILKIFSHYRFLKLVQTFVLQRLKYSTKTEEGKAKWEIFFKQFVQLAKLSIDFLSAAELMYLNHALVFIRSVLARLQQRMGVQEQCANISAMLIFLESKIKKEELEKEKVSSDDKNEMKTISILPTKKDLFDSTSGLKKNIIEGAYDDVEHYLTVQFKLLREDFIAPLREGVAEYLTSLKTGSTVRKSGFIIYRNVQILCASIDSGKFGYVLQLDGKVNWELIKHFFLFGSLLFFTNDNFNNFFLATVIDVNEKFRKITVKLNKNHHSVCEDIYAEKFVMAVSKVFFEPYFHVLTALQEMETEEFPMEKYIVKVNPDPKPPAYIEELGLTQYTIQERQVNIFEPAWGEFQLVKFNPSQQKAFQAALTNEFVAIQGPPGTGKTFLGYQIVSTLLDNVYTNTPILVICYKNHALDQFLEGISKKTKSIVRIGGRSQNENLEKFNIKKLRNRYDYRSFLNRLETLARDYFRRKYRLDGLKKHGIVSLKDVLPYIQNTEFKKQITKNYYEEWLLEGMYFDDDEFSDFRRVMESMEDYGANVGATDNSHNIRTDLVHSMESASSKFGSVNQNHLKLENSDEVNSSFVQKAEHSTEIEPVVDLSVHQSEEIGANIDKYDVGGHESNTDEKWKTVNEQMEQKSEINSSDPFREQEGNQKRLDQIYVDDYSEVYERVKQNIQAEITQSNLSNFNLPVFQLTIHSLKNQCEQFEKKITKLQEEIVEIATDKFQKGSNNEEKLTKKKKKILTDERNQMVLTLQTSIEDLKARIAYLNKMIHGEKLKLNDDQAEKLYRFGVQASIWALKPIARWTLYDYWLEGLAKDIRKQMIQVENCIRIEEQEVDKARNEADLTILKRAKVVGMTTTGAAKLRSTLNKLGAKIVVIEEAAEVLESHIVAALSAKCQHVILIGDHKQLRPNPAVYKLCTKFNFDVSLFERMIKNGLCCYQLSVQHRMRPELASLIVPTIYDNLMNHWTTENRPDILGVKSNLFFVNHNHFEDLTVNSISHVNYYEAEFVVELARYLVLQGYKSEEITILATYSRQVRQIKKLQERTKPVTSNIRVSTVDDFQGEENKIIILSLVRSNDNRSVGFLKTENRVCVALSRARDGLYIIGNMDLLEGNSEIWSKVKESLQKNNAYGESLIVYCQNHPGTILSVKKGDVLEGLREGGCHLKCDTKLECGHNCQYYCHPRDQAHEERYACSRPCERKICVRNHPCPLVCSETCEPCSKIVEFELPCEHKRMAACSSDISSLRCLEFVEFELPCEHKRMAACSSDISSLRCLEIVEFELPCTHKMMAACRSDISSLRCLEIVEFELLCGHKMTAACSSDVNELKCKTNVKCVLPSCKHEGVRYCCETEEQREKRCKCSSICGKIMKCGHICKDKCHVNNKCLLMNCSEIVETVLKCGHTKMTNCYKVYPEHNKASVKCDKIVDKCFSCGHVYSGPCSSLPEMTTCPVQVEKALPCGHKIEIECGKSIKNVVCTIRTLRTLPCGHQVTTNCNAAVTNMQCSRPCGKTASCGHPCGKRCGLPCSCKTSIERELPCGHVQFAQCNQSVDLIKCEVVVKSTLLPDCGHDPVDVPCHFNKMAPQNLAETLAKLCKAPCQQTLPCSHPCSGVCGKCATNGNHNICDEQCARALMCGHMCPLKCKEPCAPCYNFCLNQCEHGLCGGVCGGYCMPCMEPCTLGCIHRKCSRYCSFFCDRLPCDAPCPWYLPCGHPCLGLCGELCPILCSICNPMVFGGRNIGTTRFIILEDCGHIWEVNKIDQLVKQQSLILPKCAVCQTPIVTTKRYRNDIRLIFKNMMIHKRNIEAKSNTEARVPYTSNFKKDRQRN